MVDNTMHFIGSHDNKITADIYFAADSEQQRVALLTHGGGQTRHSWGNTAKALAAAGWTAITVDQRGHGESDWDTDGRYGFDSFAEDQLCIAEQIKQQFDTYPVSIGASLGGLASLLAAGEFNHDIFSALVLVDITPRMKAEGVEQILEFMSQDADKGFANLEQAADAIAAYLPNRSRPKSLKGLSKNLRLHDDGRYRWHWDPQFIKAKKAISQEQWDVSEKRLQKATTQLEIPTLLVRGQQSTLVTEAEVADFLALAPNAKFTDVSDAGHMISGDKNDAFTAAVLEFLIDL